MQFRICTQANWSELDDALRTAFKITIFGYSAPRADVDAIALLKNAWSGERKRDYEQVELIDIRSQAELLESWNDFIYSHHFHVVDDYFKSSIARYPRRTCEEEWQRSFYVRRTTANPAPRDASLEQFRDWYRPLIDAELNASQMRTT